MLVNKSNAGTNFAFILPNIFCYYLMLEVSLKLMKYSDGLKYGTKKQNRENPNILEMWKWIVELVNRKYCVTAWGQTKISCIID